MQKLLITLLADALCSVSLGAGALLLASPAVLFWWVYANHERYVWIVTGPWPYNQLGTPQFQLGVFLSLLVMGVALLSVGLIGRAVIVRKLLQTRSGT